MRGKEILKKVDVLFSMVLGLNDYQIKPNSVELISNEIVITYTEPSKRHLHKEGFKTFEIDKTSKNDKELLGLATGKALANKLIISFEEPVIRTQKK